LDEQRASSAADLFAARNGFLDVFVTCGNDDRIA
jgi:hypothetical protein